MYSDLAYAASQLDRRVVESPEMLGKECITCRNIMAYKFFPRDSSYRDGRKDQCSVCAAAPRLSNAEHVARLTEQNQNSEGTKRQRFENQSEYKDDAARIGRGMQSADFLRILQRIIPTLYLTDAAVVGDVALYQTADQPKPDWNDRSFKYLGYCPTGFLPEYSQYEFHPVYDYPVREKQRGWRTVLLRMIESGLLRIRDCDAIFGRADGAASGPWYRQVAKFY